MPEPASDPTERRHPSALNDPQRRRLRVTCQYIDKLLGDIESVLHASESESPFPRYLVDITPAQTRVIQDHIRRLRAQLLRTLAWQHMEPNPADIPATRAVMTDLSFIDIAIEELKLSYMRGYGDVSADATTELNGVVYELRCQVEGVERYIRQKFGADLETRLRKLEESGRDVNLLQLIERIAARQGLVEFRSRIDLLASGMENKELEVALFGRVSSGKSSLLNALLGTNVLPVGINPITTVPTRLVYGASLRAAVAYGDGRSEIVSIEQLANLVTEQGNPGNLRNVVRAVVEVPSPRLNAGIVLVDTPGLGSLAKRGGAETLAYLPACDLALLLIDAGATLNFEDIGTLRLLYEAGIPAIVLLSKADLLAEADLHPAISYIQEQIRKELGLESNIYPVSSLSKYSELLERFFEQELLPRFNRARSLRHSSVARKIGVLRGSVIAVLETDLERKHRSQQRVVPVHAQDLEDQLRRVTGMIGEQRTALDNAFFKLAESPEAVLDSVVDAALRWMRNHSESRVASLQLSEWIHDAIRQDVERSIANVARVSRSAVEMLQRVAREMGRVDVPAPEEIEIFLRDMPRFEIAALPEDIAAGPWMFLGDGIARARIKSNLRQNIGELLQQELHQYGRALSQWNRQFAGKMEFLVNSYSEAYRVQLQRISGSSKTTTGADQVESDLALLRNWEAEESPNEMQKHG